MDGKEVVLLPYKTASRTVPQSALGDAEPPPGSDASNGNQHSQKASLRVTSLTAAPGLCSCSSQKRPPPLSLISVTFYSASGLTYTPHPVT